MTSFLMQFLQLTNANNVILYQDYHNIIRYVDYFLHFIKKYISIKNENQYRELI